MVNNFQISIQEFMIVNLIQLCMENNEISSNINELNFTS